MIVLNFTEKARRRQIHQRSTLVAYLPTQFRKAASEEKGLINDETSSNGISSIEDLYALYECIEIAVKTLTYAAKKGIECIIRVHKQILFYILLASYDGEIPD